MGRRSLYRCRTGRISCIALPDFKKGKPARRKKPPDRRTITLLTTKLTVT